MNCSRIVLASLLVWGAVAVGAPIPKIIFDTDMVEDYDDVGALACLHALADEGRCEILAMATCTRDNQSVAAVEVLNAFYGRPEIPVGCSKGMGVVGVPSGDPKRPCHRKYARLAKEYAEWVRHPNSNDAPDANEVYRKALASAPDKSVVFCSVGFMTNMRRLLETKADRHSPLDGCELVRRKVKEWYVMACKSPSGREYNAKHDGPSTKIAFERWPTPIVVSDFDLGANIYSGRTVAERSYSYRNPVHDIFLWSLPSRERIRSGKAKRYEEEGGQFSWDEATVLAAVYGAECYFELERGEYAIAENGQSEWRLDENGRFGRLVPATKRTRRRYTNRDVGAVLNELIAREPKCRRVTVAKTNGRAQLTGGSLLAAREKCLRMFSEKIDPARHERGVSQVGSVAGRANAMQEFAGHYLDLCATFFALDGSETARRFGLQVVKSAAANMRADGYLGGEPDGCEYRRFSVWNQAHVTYGLLRYARETGDPMAAELARRAGDWLLKSFERRSPAELVDVRMVSNRGSQDLVSFYVFCLLTDFTGDRRYVDAPLAKLHDLESTKMNLLSAPDCLSLQSRKGIEMLNAYRGVLGLALRSGDAAARTAAVRYWTSLADTQIRNTGGSGGGPGVAAETFCPNGNAPQILRTEDHPNENCVQCGWLRFTRECFDVTQAARCGDEMERALYNQILGSYANDGSDFAYFQGNVGRKILKKNAFYECCRYRGFAVLAHLPEIVFSDDGKFATPLVYAPISYQAADDFSLDVMTDYPADNRIFLVADGGKNGRALRLRIPSWCGTSGWKAEVNGESVATDLRNGFLEVDVSPKTKCHVSLSLNMNLQGVLQTIDDKEYVEYRFGPLVMTRDTHFGDKLGEPIETGLKFQRVDADALTFVRFVAKDEKGKMHMLVDYAAAGRHDPDKDEYETFLLRRH